MLTLSKLEFKGLREVSGLTFIMVDVLGVFSTEAKEMYCTSRIVFDVKVTVESYFICFLTQHITYSKLMTLLIARLRLIEDTA